MLYKYVMDRPIRVKLLLFYLPVAIFSVLLTGIFSYFSAAHQLEKNEYSLLNDTIKQTNIFLEDKLFTMFEQLFSIENDPAVHSIMLNPQGSSEKYADVVRINDKFNDIYMKYYEMVDSIYLCTNNGKEYTLLKEGIPKHIGIDLNQWVERYNGSRNGYYWLNSHEDEVFSTVKQRQVLSVFKIIGTHTSALKGILLINLKRDYFLKVFRNANISSNGYFIMLSPDGIMRFKNPDIKYAIGQTGIDFLRKNMGNAGSFRINKSNGEKLFVVFNSLSINHWIVAAVVPEKDIFENASHIKYFLVVTVLLLILLSSAITTFFAENISRPIKYLSMQVKQFEKGDFNVQFEIRDNNELGVLAKGLSSLVRSVKDLITRVEEEQEKKRKIELLALQSQIKPHFLYNTLWSLKYLIELRDFEGATKMVGAITRFFMIGINKGKEIITIREELEHVKNYLIIQKIRYSTHFDYAIEVDEAILDCKIIKLTLQPLVENAIEHGIKNKLEKGTIRISGREKDNGIVLEVFDDGPGIDDEKRAKLLEAIHSSAIEEHPITYGLKNVNERIRLHFGEPYGIGIESLKGQYTMIRVHIPYRI